MKDKNVFRFEHNATESRFVAKHKPKLLSFSKSLSNRESALSFYGGMKDKNEFGFEHNATESRFVANRMSELFIFHSPIKREVESPKKNSKFIRKKKNQILLPHII